VLAVGDAYFMHKSTNRIREFQESGTSLIVVAHDRAAIQALCDRVLLIDKGRPLLEGEPDKVLDYYNALIAERESSTIQQRPLEDGRIQTVSGSGEARVTKIEMGDENGLPLDYVIVGQIVTLTVEITVHTEIPELVFGYLIKDRLGHSIYGTNTFHTQIPLENLKAGEVIRLNFRFSANLGTGSYSVATALHTGHTHLNQNFEWQDLALVFQVHNTSSQLFAGVNWMPPHISVTR
jgi:lipopolysaccharide transport system ATP-binding protein